MERPHEYIYVDEAGFNLTKRRRRGRNVIGHRAIVCVPGQRGGNVTLCAAISNHGVVHHHANLGPYNTHQLLIFLNHMRDALLGQQDEHPIYVVVWDNVSFHRALQVFYQSLPSTVLPFPKPHWGILLLMVVEGIWTPTLHQGKSPASHGTCLWWHGCGGMPSLDTACQGFFPPLPGQTKCGLWCGWSPVAWPSTETWCCGWVMHLFVYFCTLFLHGLTVHKWQTHKISVCFYKCYV